MKDENDKLQIFETDDNNIGQQTNDETSAAETTTQETPQVKKDDDYSDKLARWEDPRLKEEKKIIKVVGVGGGGCNAVSNMYSTGMEGVTFAVCDTNKVSLNTSPVPYKLLLGKSGLGAGSKPQRGREEAELTIEEIKTLFKDDTQMAFITAGMGSGTGTGAAPLVARLAKEMGILTIGIVTLPFYFEKRRKISKALLGLEEMRKNVDALLIINNQQICKIYSTSDISIHESFLKADQVLCDAAKSISELITITGTIDVDFRDVEATMRDGGGAIMAMGRASGKHRIEQAFENALNSPLLYGSDISKAKRILFNIYASKENPIFVREFEEVDAFMDTLNPDIDVIWGAAEDNSLGDDVKVTILATGFENRLWDEKVLEERDITDAEYLDEIIFKLYGLRKRSYNTSDDDDDTIENPPLTIQVGNEQITLDAASTKGEESTATDGNVGETDINVNATTGENTSNITGENAVNEPVTNPDNEDDDNSDDESDDDMTTDDSHTAQVNSLPNNKGFINRMREKFQQIVNDWIADSNEN